MPWMECSVVEERLRLHLMGLLAFIRTAHYWTVLHPELSFEDDVRELLKVNEELARLLLEAKRRPAATWVSVSSRS